MGVCRGNKKQSTLKNNYKQGGGKEAGVHCQLPLTGQKQYKGKSEQKSLQVSKLQPSTSA